MRQFILALLGIFLYVPGNSFAAGMFYLTSDQVELVKLLPPPPDPNSEAQKHDLSAVLAIQDQRTPKLIGRAEADNVLSVFRFNDVLGENFKADRLPFASGFFDRSHADARSIIIVTKNVWRRPRPFKVSNEVIALGTKPRTGFGYPSGTTIFGTLTAIILANMIPEKQKEIFERSAEFSANRLVLGVHYPTDIEAGRLAATLIAAALMKTPSFMRDFETAKMELRTALEYPIDAVVSADGATSAVASNIQTGSITNSPAVK